MTKDRIDLSVFCFRARAFLSKERTEEALALLGDVLQVDVNNGMAYAYRGIVYAMLERADVAVADLARALELGYRDVTVYAALGNIYFGKKDLDRSLRFFEEAIAADPSYPLTYYNRANVFGELSNSAAALADLRKCLEFNPDDSLKESIKRKLIMMDADSGKPQSNNDGGKLNKGAV